MTLYLSFPSMYKSRYKSSKIKLWASLTEAWSPRVILFFFSLLFSLCSSFRMIPWNTGALLAFCVNQGRSSLFLFPFYFPYRLCRHPEGTPDPAGAGLRQHFKKKMYTNKKDVWGHFPGGPVVKNQSANPGDMGSIPCPGRSHISRGN